MMSKNFSPASLPANRPCSGWPRSKAPPRIALCPLADRAPSTFGAKRIAKETINPFMSEKARYLCPESGVAPSTCLGGGGVGRSSFLHRRVSAATSPARVNFSPIGRSTDIHRPRFHLHQLAIRRPHNTTNKQHLSRRRHAPADDPTINSWFPGV